MKLWVVTPVSRPENLPVIKHCLEANAPDCTWLIYYDLGARAIECRRPVLPQPVSEVLLIVERCFHAGKGWGHEARNLALKEIPSDAWIYWLDDDNLLHPELVPTARAALEENPHCRAMVFQQERNGSVEPAHIAACFTDMGQVLVQRSALGDFRFDVHKREADGIMVLWLQERIEWTCVPVTCTFYNRLSW